VPEIFLAPFLGSLVDKYGARWLVGAGGLIVALAFAAMAAVTEIWQLYLFRGFIVSAGAVCLGSFLGVSVANWFVAYRPRAVSIMQMGSSAANAALPVVTATVVAAAGWRSSWIVMGLLTMALVIPAVVIFRRRPEDVGLLPDGAEPGAEGASTTLSSRRLATTDSDVTWTRGQVMTMPVFWIMSFAFGVSTMALTATNLHLVPFLIDLGYPLEIAAAAVSFRATIGFLGSPVLGFGIERISFRLAMILPFVFQTGSMLALLFFPTTEGILLSMTLYGAGYAGVNILTELAWAHYFGRLSLGTVRGLAFPVQTVLASAGPLAMGLISDTFHSYQLAWLALALGFGLSGLLLQFARPPRPPARPALEESTTNLG
jgi:MFS family permease